MCLLPGQVEHQHFEGEAGVGVAVQPVGRAAQGLYRGGDLLHAEATGVVAQCALAVHVGHRDF